MQRITATFLLTFTAAQSLAAPVPAARTFVDATQLLTNDTMVDAWYGGMVNMRVGFDEICADTFCAGDYTNIQPLRLRCSADAATHVISRCQWTFAASNETVNPSTGQIKVDAPIYRCRIPIAPRTTVADLAHAWNVADPLRATVPRTGSSVYDALADCL